MLGLQNRVKLTTYIIAKLLGILSLSLLAFNTQASWYTGGAILLHPLPYHTVNSNYIKLGSSKLNVIANGIAINGGYKANRNKYMFATSLI